MTKKETDVKNKIFKLIVLAVFVFSLFQVISMRVNIAQKDRDLARIEEEIHEQKLKNSEYNALLSEENKEDFYRNIAEDELNYAESDEILYIDITGY